GKWSKRGECPDKRAATNNKANKRKPKKQIVSGHAGFWLKQVTGYFSQTNACRSCYRAPRICDFTPKKSCENLIADKAHRLGPELTPRSSRVLRRAGHVLDPANRLYRVHRAVANAIDGDGARPRRALCELSTQAVV